MADFPGDVWDVVVVGAGPAGSASARAAAILGVRVLLLDKAKFPRYKTCGGGLLGTSMSLITDQARATVERNIDGIRLSRNLGRQRTRSSAKTILQMVQRDRFDQASVDAAVAAGAIFRDSTNVRGLETLENGLVKISTSDDTILARVVVGADGAGGRVGRHVGAVMGGVDLGLEAEIPLPHDQASTTVINLDWGQRAGTYAWVFPKQDSLTVGVIERKGYPSETGRYLDSWLSRLGLDSSTSTRTSGHLTQWRTPESPLRKGNVLLAGETAGLLEPWTREGISFALRSGNWAGEAAASAARGDDDAISAYVRRVNDELEPEIAAGRMFLDLYAKHPALVHLATSYTRAGASYLFRFCEGEVSLATALSNATVAKVARRLSR